MKRFTCDYQFLAAGDVFSRGLEHGANDLGIQYAHASWDDAGLLGQVQQFTPDLLLVVHGRRFCQLYRHMPVAASAVWLLDEPYEVDDTAQWSGRFSTVFVNDSATLDRHKHAHYLPTCYDPTIHRVLDIPKPYSVGFVGGANQTRDRYLAALAKYGVLSYAIGGPWATPAVQAICMGRNISPTRTASLYQQTRIVVNVFREQHHYNARQTAPTALNPRIYEATACGALVVSEWRPEVEKVCPELPTFRNEMECVSLIQDLLIDHERREFLQQTCQSTIGDEYICRPIDDGLARGLSGDGMTHLYTNRVGPAPDLLPRVSVISTVYNRWECLALCLKSMQQSQYADFEHIVVSDAPGDRDELRIQRLVEATADPRVSYVALRSRHNDWGITPAAIGLSVSRGEYVCFLSDDNAYLPGHLPPLVAMLDADAALGFVYSSCHYGGQHGKKVLAENPPRGARIDLGQLLFRRSVFKKHLQDGIPFHEHAWDWRIVDLLMKARVQWAHHNATTFVFSVAKYPEYVKAFA